MQQNYHKCKEYPHLISSVFDVGNKTEMEIGFFNKSNDNTILLNGCKNSKLDSKLNLKPRPNPRHNPRSNPIPNPRYNPIPNLKPNPTPTPDQNSTTRKYCKK